MIELCRWFFDLLFDRFEYVMIGSEM